MTDYTQNYFREVEEVARGIDQNEVDQLRKVLVKFDLLLSPRQFRGQQIVDVGINREVSCGVNGRNDGKQQTGSNNKAEMAGAVTHPANDP